MKFRAGFLCIALLTISCGGNGGTPTTPSPNPPGGGGGGGGGGGAANTITITAAGANPREITVSPGTRVTFVNNDTRPHEMNSDPHPTHGDCPAIDVVGFLSAGQTKVTGNLNEVRRCGFHDHQQPNVVALQGTIIVQ